MTEKVRALLETYCVARKRVFLPLSEPRFPALGPPNSYPLSWEIESWLGHGTASAKAKRQNDSKTT